MGILGGCRGDGGTDCHSQCVHWLRNDTLQGARRAGRRGRRPLRGVQGVQWAGDRKGRPYGGLQGVRCAGRRGRRPLRKRILWCVGEGLCPSRGRPQGSPLRKGYMGCGRGGALPLPRATARVAPTGGTGGAVGGPSGTPAPTGGTRGAMGGRPQGSPLRKRYMGCGAKSAGGVEPRPYEGLQGVTACGGGLRRCIRGAFCSARRYYGPPGPRFGPGRDRR